LDVLQQGDLLVVRSHGAPPEVYDEVKSRGIVIVDATCPFVQKAQYLAREAADSGCFVVVAGDASHPEVRGILGWAGANACAVADVASAQELPTMKKLAVLAQTTLSRERFTAISVALRARAQQIFVYDTICSATQARQEAAAEVAASVEAMIIVGGKDSSNTRELAAICSKITPTYLIESALELKPVWLLGAGKVGLSAGASTPDRIIEEVFKTMNDQETGFSNLEENELEEKTAQGISESVDDSTTATEETTAETEEATAAEAPETESGNFETTAEAPAADLTEPEEDPFSDEAAKDQASMMENLADGLSPVHKSSIVEGTVVKVTGDEVFVDIGWKSEGVIQIAELSTVNGEPIKVGDKVKAQVVRMENQEGYMELSRRSVRAIEARETLLKYLETKEEVQAPVVEAVKGGLLVDLGMRGFIPASQIQLGFVEKLDKFVGETLRLRVIEFDENKKRLILSQKVILQEELDSRRKQLMETMSEGDIIHGIVRRLASFGAFVDIGGVDGLLHISDMAFSRINHPSEIVKIGEELDVKVLKIEKERGRISLGLKQIKESPWTQVAEKYPVDTIIEGKVVRIANFGAFVQLEDGVDALVHISQLAHYRVAKVHDVLKAGDLIKAKVIECRPNDKRISLSLKELQPNPEPEDFAADEDEGVTPSEATTSEGATTSELEISSEPEVPAVESLESPPEEESQEAETVESQEPETVESQEPETDETQEPETDDSAEAD
jgi:4-hydroxy-3-methylbut-2-enyl diphosphate reductase